ncbi:MAG: YifB family Mg chelatase-like AAA ATPase [Lachnospiraceae bacterium]
MLFSTISGAVCGVNGYMIAIEVDMADGLPCIEMVGSLGREVKESAERVRVALRNIGYIIPPKRFTVNLSPAGIKKGGTAFDVPIALGILGCMGCLEMPECESVLSVGELGLDGSVRGVKGVLPILLAAKDAGINTCIVPESNRREGECVNGIRVIGVENFCEILDYLSSPSEFRQRKGNVDMVGTVGQQKVKIPDFSNIAGQTMAKRAAEIAAAGFHNLLLYGPPGTGKSMIASAIPGILPPMDPAEMLDTSGIYSVAGLLDEEKNYIRERPFMSPHHTITPQALIGGGVMPGPGIISLANHGVLFLDELPEFKRRTLDMLRQPIEEGKITITRKSGNYTYPCNFMLVAAMNPCPCGYYPDRNKCTCSDREVHRYVKSISGPLLNRIDLSVGVMRSAYQEIICSGKEKENSHTVRKRVMKARKIQQDRNGGTFNGRIPVSELSKICRLTREGEREMENYYIAKELSMRGYHRMLRVARTIADLEGSEKIEGKHIMEAAAYRSMLD